MARKLTLKQQLFIREYIARNGNGTQAALAVYDTDTPAVANRIASENVQKRSIHEEIRRLVSQKLTPDRIINVLDQALDAENKDLTPDWNPRLRAADMSLKLMDAYPRERGPASQHEHRHLHLESLTPAMLERLAETGEPPIDVEPEPEPEPEPE